jgi:tRNA-specific 2-thiouridylase
MVDRQPVAVAMSGGVDSSVAAAVLADEGYPVIGLMLRLWSPGAGQPDNRCCSPHDMATARQVARQLHIPFYVLDAQFPFRRRVVDVFVRGYAQGITPNPCLTCNQTIRWGFLLEHALAMGASHLATGHYARLDWQAGSVRLLRGIDRAKDQSYVLATLSQHQLQRTLLPLGERTKTEVRDLARHFALPVAERPDSQDLCFLGGRDYRGFFRAAAPDVARPGPLADEAGRVLGTHTGLPDYTIGQRKGIGRIPGGPVYVLRKDVSTNTLVVAPRHRLARSQFETLPVHWISGRPPPTAVRASVRVRYKAREVAGSVTPLLQGGAAVCLDEGLPDITPGQFAAFYQDAVCLGAGEIKP